MSLFITLREAYVEASSLLASKGIIDHGSCAELLLLDVLQINKTDMLTNWNETFPEDKRKIWLEHLHRKASGEPLQYIIGTQEFYGYTFQVNRHVLIPRPETELLVEAIIQYGSFLFESRIPQVADIGTGSGAIAISIAKNRPFWQISACDISEDALAVAKKNELAHQLTTPIQWVHGNLLIPFMADHKDIDILVANLPYIPIHDLPHLQTEVKDHEPALALFAGDDGLDVYRRLIIQLRSLAKLPFLIGFEIGIHQDEKVIAMLRELYPWDELKVIPDLAGIARHIMVSRNL
jgi:release factor glutamine methyltransferase